MYNCTNCIIVKLEILNSIFIEHVSENTSHKYDTMKRLLLVRREKETKRVKTGILKDPKSVLWMHC